MLCCKDCNLQTDATFTTVLFIDQLSQQRTHALQNYAEKHLKKMQVKKEKKCRKKDVSFIQEKWNKENKESFGNQRVGNNSAEKRGIKSIGALKEIQHYLSQRKNIENDKSGKFNQFSEDHQPTKESQIIRKNLESKTTSFGSLRSRKSLTVQFLQRAQLSSLQQQLQSMRQQQMSLLRQKLNRQFLYKKQLSKIKNMKDSISSQSRQRQKELNELRQLFMKKKGNHLQ